MDANILHLVFFSRLVSKPKQETKYSRIPVYSGEIDRISGVVLSKDLLDFVQVLSGLLSGLSELGVGIHAHGIEGVE